MLAHAQQPELELRTQFRKGTEEGRGCVLFRRAFLVLVALHKLVSMSFTTLRRAYYLRSSR